MTTLEKPLHRFAYVANATPIFQGAIAAAMLLALAFAWAWATGRVPHLDALYLGMVFVCVTVIPVVVLWSQLRGYRRAAAVCGHVEVDGLGVRWRRPDDSLGLQASWSEFTKAVVDPRNFHIVLTRHEGAPVLLGMLTQHGVPSGAVVLEGFADLVELVKAKVATAPYEGAKDTLAARRTLGLGGAGLLLAVALYGVNVALAAKLGWTRWLMPMPTAIAALSLLAVVAGARLWAGHGPLVSPIYGRQQTVAMLRFFAVAVVANFVLLGVANAL